jgi:hypothetical protein
MSTTASYVSALRGRISIILTSVLKTAPHQTCVPLGDYEKTRIADFMIDINEGRMTFDEARQAIRAGWKASFGPSSRFRNWRQFTFPTKYGNGPNLSVQKWAEGKQEPRLVSQGLRYSDANNRTPGRDVRLD